jgi:hypothetical protein
MFASRARTYFTGALHWGRLRALSTNIRLGWKRENGDKSFANRHSEKLLIVYSFNFYLSPVLMEGFEP